MAWPFSSLWTPKPTLKPSGITTALCCYDINALDTALRAVSKGEMLALSDGHGPDANGELTWMLPKVIPLTRTGNKPFVILSLEFRLLGHKVDRVWIDVILEGDCGTQGELRLVFPPPVSANARGWQLHIVAPHQGAQAPPELMSEPEDAENSVKRKRDDIFRKMFG